MSVSAAEACQCVCAEKCPCPTPTEPGKMAAFAIPTIPAFLLPLAEQLVAKYGPEIVDYLEKAAVAGIEALAVKFHLVPKSPV